jgi:hypothetical protein
MQVLRVFGEKMIQGGIGAVDLPPREIQSPAANTSNDDRQAVGAFMLPCNQQFSSFSNLQPFGKDRCDSRCRLIVIGLGGSSHCQQQDNVINLGLA